KGPNATYGDLTVDNKGISGQATELPSLGSGTVQTVTSYALNLNRGTIPPYFSGHWLKVTDSTKTTTRGIWRISAIDPTTNVVTVQGGQDPAIVVTAGSDVWQGVYRFDNPVVPAGSATLKNLSTAGLDPILIGSSGGFRPASDDAAAAGAASSS